MEMKIHAERILKERKAKAWSQQHLADASGLSLRTIQRVENNATGSLETIKALASCFELNVNQLFVPEKQKVKSYFKAKIAALSSLFLAFLSTLFLTSATMASDISISAEQMKSSQNENFQIFRHNVEIFVPHSISFEVLTDAMWGNESASVAERRVEIKLEDSTLVINKAIILKTEQGVKITSDYAEQHFDLPKLLHCFLENQVVYIGNA